jgi:hypothetical protein
MVRPPVIRLNTAALLREANATRVYGREGALQRRQLSLAGHRALAAAQKAYQLEQEFIGQWNVYARSQWQTRRDLVMAELTRISKLEPLS